MSYIQFSAKELVNNR